MAVRLFMHNSESDVIRPVAPSLDEPEGISPTVEVELRRLAQGLEDTSLSPGHHADAGLAAEVSFAEAAAQVFEILASIWYGPEPPAVRTRRAVPHSLARR